MTDAQLAADRTLAQTTMGNLRSLRERQHYRLTKTQRRCLLLAEQALDMFLEDTTKEI